MDLLYPPPPTDLLSSDGQAGVGFAPERMVTKQNNKLSVPRPHGHDSFLCERKYARNMRLHTPPPSLVAKLGKLQGRPSSDPGKSPTGHKLWTWFQQLIKCLMMIHPPPPPLPHCDDPMQTACPYLRWAGRHTSRSCEWMSFLQRSVTVASAHSL